MIKVVATVEASQVFGVSVSTLRCWGAGGTPVAECTAIGHRRYDLTKLRYELIRQIDGTEPSYFSASDCGGT